jgi:hypothetical protein
MDFVSQTREKYVVVGGLEKCGIAKRFRRPDCGNLFQLSVWAATMADGAYRVPLLRIAYATRRSSGMMKIDKILIHDLDRNILLIDDDPT